MARVKLPVSARLHFYVINTINRKKRRGVLNFSPSQSGGQLHVCYYIYIVTTDT